MGGDCGVWALALPGRMRAEGLGGVLDGACRDCWTVLYVFLVRPLGQHVAQCEWEFYIVGLVGDWRCSVWAEMALPN